MVIETIYDLELNGNNFQAVQSDKILVKLKPHQLTSLYKAIEMENNGEINYKLQDIYNITDNSNITDGNNITKITPLGISTNYGNLSFNLPTQMVVDSVGNVFVVCIANTVIKVEPSGVSTPFGVYPLGTNTNSIAIDSSDNIYVANEQTVWKLTPSAVQTIYGTTSDFQQRIAIDSSDNIYATLQNATVEKVSIGGTTLIADLSGYGGFPYAIIVDANFNVYVTDINNDVVYLIVQ